MNEKQLMALIEQLYQALDSASDHLEYCNYGDSYERECAFEQKLPEKIEAAMTAAQKSLPYLSHMT